GWAASPLGPVWGRGAYPATIGAPPLPALPQEILKNKPLHTAEPALSPVVGYLFSLPLRGHEPIRWRLSYPMRLLVLALAMPIDTFTGLILGYAGRGYVVTVGPRPPRSPRPAHDGDWAGAATWVRGAAIMFA